MGWAEGFTFLKEEKMEFDDLRGFIEVAGELEEVKEIEKADWNLEIGALTEIEAENHGPLLVFDKIQGYPAGFRVVSNAFVTLRRTAAALGLPQDLTPLETLKTWRQKVRDLRLIPPMEVGKAPILENVVEGDDIDLYKFPVPKWHEGDGGRYIGTGDMVITKDPDEGWVNFGTYRVMIQSKNSVSILAIHGQHGRMMMEKYHAKGKSCPVAIVVGQDPSLFAVSTYRVPWGISEYDFAGGIKGRPIEVTRGHFTGLPIPARAEIVLEGEIPPLQQESCHEGPFGEWPGYYTGEFDEKHRLAPLVKVKSVLYRNQPILFGAPPLKPPIPSHFAIPLLTAASIWDQLEAAGYVGIKGVWSLVTYGSLLTVVAIEQKYAGHAKQVGVAAAVCPGGAAQGKWTIIVDDDIDISDPEEVLWAMGTRCDVENIDIIRGVWSAMTPPLVKPQLKAGKFPVSSRAVVDACRPFDWRKEFPPVNVFSSEYKKKIAQKFGIQMKKR
jgi:UbiD family decarboxylase